MLPLLRRTRLLAGASRCSATCSTPIGGLPLRPRPPRRRRRCSHAVRSATRLWSAAGAAVRLALWQVALYRAPDLTLGDVGHVLLLGLLTLIRVVVDDRAGDAGLGADRRLARAAAGLGRRAQPVAQFLAAFPANLFFPIFVVGIVHFHAQPRHLADAADDPRHAVVHPVQRDRRRRRVPGRPAGGGAQLPDRRLAVVAAGDAAGHLPVLRDRGDHRVRRRLERRDRGGGRELGRHEADGARARRLHRAGHRGRRHRPRRAGRGRRCRLRDPVQPAAVAADVCLRRAPPHPVA